MQHLKVYSKQDILHLTKLRKYETKIGEQVLVAADPQNIAESIKGTSAEYVLVGVPECIGVRAYEGEGRSDTAWFSFLKHFLNSQSNDFFEGSSILALGYFDFTDLEKLIETNAMGPEEKLMAYRHAVHQIDEEIEPLIKLITGEGKIPIVIGCGHNNSYPLIKGAAKGLHKAGLISLPQINAVNLDAHTEFQPIEGRHSGNGFRYAEEDGYLEKYCVIGVQENFVSQNVWLDIRNNPFTDLITYEDIFVLEKRNFTQAVAHATGFAEDNYIGLEVDLDAVVQAASGLAPSGITPLNARQFVTFAAIDSRIAYLHVCEGAFSLCDGCEDPSIGKLISYIVSDFIKVRE